MNLTAVATGLEPAPEFYNFTRDCVEHWAEVRGDELAMWWVDETGQRQEKITFRQMADRARRACAFFHELGIRPGDRVAVIAHRIPQWWYATLGLIRLGAVPIPGTPLLTAPDIAYRLQVSEAVAMVADDAAISKVESLGTSFAGKKIAMGPDVPGWISFTRGMENASPDFEPALTRSEAPGIIYFTSGTSGNAKMVLHTQVSYGLAHAITGHYWLDLKPQDMIWALADTGWGKTAWSNMYGPWTMGSCVFVMDMRGKFDPSVVLRALCDFPISVFCAPATALRLLVRKDLKACHFKALRHCVSAGESLNAPLYSMWLSGTGLHVYEGYGQTETVLSVCNARCHGLPIRPGSMGHPSPGFDVAIVDDEGNPLPPCTEGNLAIRVKPKRPIGMFAGYWKNPEETASRYRGDWYLTGDSGLQDEDGYLWFVGRSDDVINSASYRIGPSEVETALLLHPSVLECAAIGVPDEMRGEVVKAFIVVREGWTPGEALKKEIQAHCKKVTAPYKYPRQVEFIDELPKTISGKVRRSELRHRERMKPRPQQP